MSENQNRPPHPIEVAKMSISSTIDTAMNLITSEYNKLAAQYSQILNIVKSLESEAEKKDAIIAELSKKLQNPEPTKAKKAK